MSIRPAAIRQLIQDLLPGARLLRIVRLGADHAAVGEITEKGAGYGEPLRLTVEQADGRVRELVWHTATADRFGHDRRADRAAEMLLAFDTFGSVPGQAAAVDVGAICSDGTLRSLRDCGELYLVTEFAAGEVYAADLRRIAHRRAATEQDLRRCDLLVDHLVAMHRQPLPGDVAAARAQIYARAIRDLVGHGEGIFGMVDGYPPDAPGARPERLQALESRCCRYRWRLRDRHHRLARTHGDFHPFNIVLGDGDRLALLDASRGSVNDPADDVACLAINYVFFALEDPSCWKRGLGLLWQRFWRRYLERSGDRELLEVAPPFLAWRALVIANPLWYPTLPAACRDALFGLAERALDAGRLDPESAEALFS
ncbi:MAG TPA: phosphotransferase [Haliangium sp.]|nr:phosphotransferase [Haliangium sp.]